jgi:hypothetical protein
MTEISDTEQRIIHAESQRFLSRLELETAARIARRAAQIGFLAAVDAMKEGPVTASDVHRFFPDLDGSSAQPSPGHWAVTVNDADQVFVSQSVERHSELPSDLELRQRLLRNCAQLLLDLACGTADNDGSLQPEARRRCQ